MGGWIEWKEGEMYIYIYILNIHTYMPYTMDVIYVR